MRLYDAWVKFPQYIVPGTILLMGYLKYKYVIIHAFNGHLVVKPTKETFDRLQINSTTYTILGQLNFHIEEYKNSDAWLINIECEGFEL